LNLIESQLWAMLTLQNLKPMSQGKKSLLRLELTTFINSILVERRTAIALPKLRCDIGGISISPDIAIFENKNISKDDNGEIADVIKITPNWIIEILSPDQSATKAIKSIAHCLDCGAEAGWLIDLTEKAILIHQLNRQVQIIDDLSEELEIPKFAQPIKLTAGDIFGWLKMG
jgi:Uma2 family endonuclease